MHICLDTLQQSLAARSCVQRPGMQAEVVCLGNIITRHNGLHHNCDMSGTYYSIWTNPTPLMLLLLLLHG